MGLKACAFDLGNTLVNDFELQSTAIHELGNRLAERGLIDSAAGFVDAYQRVMRSDPCPFHSHTFGEITFFADTLVSLHLSGLAAGELLEEYRGCVVGHTKRDPSVADALAHLRSRGLRTALISNESVARVDSYLETTGMKGAFDAVVVSEGVRVEKPDPQIFLIALEMLACTADEAAMFGDNDIADGACKRVGMTYVQVAGLRQESWGWERGERFAPDYVVERVDIAHLDAFLGAYAQGGSRR